MGLTKLAIRRPLTVLMVILALVVMGGRAYTMMQVDRLPKSDLPYVTVVVVYPGASPEDVAEEVSSRSRMPSPACRASRTSARWPTRTSAP